MTDTFTWRVEASASGDGEFVTQKSQFGDGYSQEYPDGINNDVQKWTVTYSAYKADVQACLAFIRDKHGAESFFWTPPLGVEGLYRCKKYKPVERGGGFWSLIMEFQQVFGP